MTRPALIACLMLAGCMENSDRTLVARCDNGGQLVREASKLWFSSGAYQIQLAPDADLERVCRRGR